MNDNLPLRLLDVDISTELWVQGELYCPPVVKSYLQVVGAGLTPRVVSIPDLMVCGFIFICCRPPDGPHGHKSKRDQPDATLES